MLLKILYDLWPFIKELYAGESDLSKAIRRNKLSALLFIVNVALFGLLIFVTHQMINRQKESKTIADTVYELKHELEACKSKPEKVCPIVHLPSPVPFKPTNNPQPNAPDPVPLENKLNAIRREDY